MRLVVLGGTRFVGRAICAAAHKRGYDVVVFNRGHSGPRRPGPWRYAVTERRSRICATWPSWSTNEAARTS